MKAVCGLDVHKDSIFLCILHSDGELFEQVFGVLTFQLEEMRKLLQKHHVFEVCMENSFVSTTAESLTSMRRLSVRFPRWTAYSNVAISA